MSHWYWLLVAILLGVLVRSFFKTIYPEEFQPTLPDSAEEALAIVAKITGDHNVWHITEIAHHFCDVYGERKYLGYVVEVASQGVTHITLYFPVSHPDNDIVSKFAVGRYLIFRKLDVAVPEADPKNPTTYVTVQLS